MKKFGPYAALAAIVLLIGVVCLPPSCTLTPEQRAQVVPLVDLGLLVAESQGWVQAGDSVKISHGFAIVTSEASKQDKIYSLARIGLQEALEQGKVQNGQTLVIGEETAQIVNSPEGLGQEVLVPPAGK